MSAVSALLLLAFALGLPIAAVLLARWAARRNRQLQERYGHWTENEAKMLGRQAAQSQDRVSELRWLLLTPIATKYSHVARVALWAAIACLTALSALSLYALVSFAFAAATANANANATAGEGHATSRSVGECGEVCVGAA